MLKQKRFAVRLILAVFCLPGFPAIANAAAKDFDLPALLREREPHVLLSSINNSVVRKKVDDRIEAKIKVDSDTATKRNQIGLYPNPGLQVYANRLALALIPREASPDLLATFRVVEDPQPYADALDTGTIYVSSGLVSLLDNESQLAFLLIHEAGHFLLSHSIYQIVREENPSFGKQLGMGLLGAVVGGLAARADAPRRPMSREELDQYQDFGDRVVGHIATNHFVKELELESDRLAIEVLLQNGFDAREVPRILTKINDVVRRSGKAVDLAFGNSQSLPQRIQEASELLDSTYKPLIDRILEGDGFRISSPGFSQLLAEVKRDNGILALNKDLFAIARENFEESASIRTDDPLTLYGLGMLYRAVGRAPSDRTKAEKFLKSAMEFDEVRHRFPEAHLQYAVELLGREDPKYYPEIQKSLKSYVVLYQRKTGGKLPPEMRFVYDYLDLTGDRGWIAYSVDNISSEPPYQFSGDQKIDGDVKITQAVGQAQSPTQ